MSMINFHDTLTLSLIEEFHFRGIGEDTYIDQLAFIEIPVRQEMYHRFFLIIGPFCLIQVECVFWKAGSIDLSEIRIFGKIWGWLAQIIKAGPEVLSKAELAVAVCDNRVLGIFRSPVCRTVSESRTLQVIKCQKTVGKRKMIDAAALYGSTCLTSKYFPVRIFYMMFVITFIEVIVADEIDHFAGALGSFPFDIIRCQCGVGIFAVIELADGIMKFFRQFQSAVKMRIINLISDSPDKDARVVAVLADPACQVFFPPVFKVIAVVVIGLCALPHIKTLSVEQESQLITEIQHMFRRHVVRISDRIYTHFL